MFSFWNCISTTGILSEMLYNNGVVKFSGFLPAAHIQKEPVPSLSLQWVSNASVHQRRSKEYHRLGGKARLETAVCNAGTRLEQPCAGHCWSDRCRSRTRWIIHRTNYEKYPGRMERTAQVFRFPGTVINRTSAAGIILPPFCVYSGVSRRLLFLISPPPGNYPNY